MLCGTKNYPNNKRYSMGITLPSKLNETTAPSTDSKNIVVIGANGAGKTRFGTDVENRYNATTHRISAQKSLSMPSEVSPKSKLRAEQEYLYGYFDQNNPLDNLRFKIGSKWGEKPNTFLLNDYEKLMVLLHTEEYEESINFKESYLPGQNSIKPKTKLDRVQSIWEFVLPHRKLHKKAGSIDVSLVDSTSKKYNASEMSDGERVIFYIIGSVISAPDNAIIIIDEPEMHIHKSIIKKLYDKIEIERTDCTFIYLTHDIDFAISRQDSLKIWAKSYNNGVWDYTLLDGNSELPEQLYLEILGSRKPILFIEGDDSSIDYRFLQLIFDDYTTKPLGSCEKVFETTKAFNEQSSFHHIESVGLIDRDRRTNEEVAHINNPNIWIAQVAEIENFLLIEEVVKEVASNMMKDSDSVFESVKSNIVSFFNSQKEKQALEHSLSCVERLFKNATNNSEVKTISEFQLSLTSFWNGFNVKNIYDEVLKEFQELIDSENYEGILKVFNNKGIIQKSQVIALCDLSTKKDAYLNYIIGLLKKDNDSSDNIKTAVKKNIEK